MVRPNLHLHLHLGNILPRHVTRSVKELYGSVAILGFASAAVSIFEPIYLYTLGYSVSDICLFFLVTYGLYLFLLPFAGKLVIRYGVERMLLVGSLCLIPYYLTLFAVDARPSLFFVAAVVLALQKMCYWIAYHTDFARNVTDGEVGREIGQMGLIITIVSILGPMIGGAIVSSAGFTTLFIVAVVLILLSNIPLLRSRQQPIRETWGYLSLFKAALSRANRRFVAAYVGYGEDFVFLVIWPVFIYVALQNFFNVGTVITVSAFITSLVLLYFGKVTDLRDKMVLLHRGALVVCISWIARTFVMGTVPMVISEVIYRIGRGAVDLPTTTQVYMRAKANKLVEGVMLLEVGLIVGKVIAIMLVFVAAQLSLESWRMTFLVAAVMSLLYALLPSSPAKRSSASS